MSGVLSRVEKVLTGALTRVRRLTLLSGVAGTGIVWVLSLVVVMLVDSRMVIFDDRIRFAMTAGVWLLTLLTALILIVRPLRRKRDFRSMARLLDARHPEHEERLMTYVELSERDEKHANFSASLFGLVRELAERDASKIDLAREFPMRGTRRLLTLLLLLFLTLGLGVAFSPNLVGRLFVRALAPWVDIGNLFSEEIVVTPGDVVVLSGTVLKIEAAPADPSVTNRQPLAANHYSIRLSRKTASGWSEETTEPMVNGVYETTTDLTEREWRYRVTAGPAVTKYYHVRVSEMPTYDLFQATITYPDYTGLKPLHLTNTQVGAIRAVAGSRVTFDVKASSDDTVVDFRINRVATRDYQMVSNRTAKWSLDLINTDGFRAEKGRATLTSFIDQPPTVVIEKPTGVLRLPPHAKIPVEITATDDLAITSAYLRASIDNGPWEPYIHGELEVGGGARFVRRKPEVDLSHYNLLFAKNIRFDVVVEDACPPEFGGPHAATSMPFTVQFVAHESSYAMKELKEKVAEAQRDIKEAQKRLKDAQHLARQVKEELKRAQKPQAQTERKSERMAHELNEAKKRIEALRDEFKEDSRFKPLSKPMEELLEEKLKPTLENVEKAQFQERTERAESIEEALPEMAEAERELNDLAKQLNERAEKVDRFEKARDLAERQEALARAAKELLEEKPNDTAKMEAWKRLEEDAMRKAAELARREPKSEFAKAQKEMSEAARAMAELKREEEAFARAEKQAQQQAKQAKGKMSGEQKEKQQQAQQQHAAKAEKMQEQVTEAAEKASEAMQREIEKQAESLGINPEEQEISRGGGVSDEMKDLAKSLKRNDVPNFLKELLARLDWFKIQGTSKDGEPEIDFKDIPREYQDLVRRYFLKLSDDIK